MHDNFVLPEFIVREQLIAGLEAILNEDPDRTIRMLFEYNLPSPAGAAGDVTYIGFRAFLDDKPITIVVDHPQVQRDLPRICVSRQSSDEFESPIGNLSDYIVTTSGGNETDLRNYAGFSAADMINMDIQGFGSTETVLLAALVIAILIRKRHDLEHAGVRAGKVLERDLVFDNGQGGIIFGRRVTMEAISNRFLDDQHPEVEDGSAELITGFTSSYIFPDEVEE